MDDDPHYHDGYDELFDFVVRVKKYISLEAFEGRWCRCKKDVDERWRLPGVGEFWLQWATEALTWSTIGKLLYCSHIAAIIADLNS